MGYLLLLAHVPISVDAFFCELTPQVVKDGDSEKVAKLLRICSPACAQLAPCLEIHQLVRKLH